MPNRIIRESCRTSKTLAQLSGDEERLFWRLTTVADDFGRFIAEPDVLLGACFPRQLDRIKVVHVGKWLQMLANANILNFYENNGTRYGVFVNWTKHQGNPRAKDSKYPNPDDPASICTHLPAKVPVSESESENRISNPKAISNPKSDPIGVGFDQFWDTYPNKAAKKDAERAWVKLHPDEQLLSRILAAIERAKTSAKWMKNDGEFIPHPATWLNGRRWEDQSTPLEAGLCTWTVKSGFKHVPCRNPVGEEAKQAGFRVCAECWPVFKKNRERMGQPIPEATHV